MPKHNPSKPKIITGKLKPRRRQDSLIRAYTCTVGHASTAVVTVRHCCPRRCDVEVSLSTMGKFPDAEGMQVVRHWLAGILVGPDTMGPESTLLRLRHHDAGVEHCIVLRTEP
jgi:hypothetical protein